MNVASSCGLSGFLECGERERFKAACKDALHVSDEHAVVDDRHACGLGLLDAVVHLAPVEHAGPAVDEQRVLAQFFRVLHAARVLEHE